VGHPPETSLSGTNLEEYIFFNGKRVARRDVSGSVVHYYFADHLGSASVVTNSTGSTPFDEDLDYYPYGGIVATSTDNVPQNYKFNGKERDAESGLDNFGARYDSSQYGRFMTPDWADETDPVPYADEEDPQTLNLYAYVRNHPMSNRDADGHHQECGATTYSTDADGNLVVHANCYEVPDLSLSISCTFGFCSAADQAKFKAQLASYNDAFARGLVPIYAAPLPIGPGDLEALGELENLLQDLKNGLQPTADSPALQKIIDQLYKTKDTVPGGTAGAVRQEVKTGQAVGGKLHSIKAAERAGQLEKLINTGTLSTKDTTLATAIMQDLRDALALAGK